MNTYTHKPTQEIYIYVMGGKSFHSIIYIMPAAIPITSLSHTHTHTHTHTHAHAHTHTHTHTPQLNDIHRRTHLQISAEMLFKKMSF